MAKKLIHIGDMAAAIGLTSRALENWVSRDGLKLSAKQNGGWREFNWGDVAIFAVTAYLRDVGMPLAMAFTHAKAIIEARFPGLFDEENPRWQITPENFVIDLYYGPGPKVSGQGMYWGISSIAPESLRSRFDSGIAKLKDSTFQARVIVSIFVGIIVGDAFSKLSEHGHHVPVLLPVGERRDHKGVRQ